MSDYKYTDDMREISGFGGGYEQCCRDMVVAGLRFLDSKAATDPKFTEYTNIYGIIEAQNDDAKAMEAAMLAAPGADGCTGAMMHASVGHVLNVRKMGWDDYATKMREMKRKEDEA